MVLWSLQNVCRSDRGHKVYFAHKTMLEKGRKTSEKKGAACVYACNNKSPNFFGIYSTFNDKRPHPPNMKDKNVQYGNETLGRGKGK